ncbi:type II toxin-antitoxin system RelE/ParE family toxin [Mesorhizobium escarrei]|uniref:Toxin RelE4 n=1 Tax=Mesorhizobium escarrei TaxID=666018 RepID=A0ABM9DQI0_9HYPH|nr:type II toxin-antitoxin system RelE/ParE family toxin [Mesorhizobium escarrei]CAH2398902.1 putative Toxin RelE4 [Mesorhizobium escarrei]
MKVRFTRQAFAEREAIFNYLEERSPQGAYSVTSRIQAGISRLAEFPESGHATDIPDVRVLFIGHYPYKVFYRARADAIEILHIRHTSRRPVS